MKKILILGAAFLAFACSNKNNTVDQPAHDTAVTDTTTALNKINATTINDEVYTGSVTNNAGIMLKQSYNKTKGTAVFEVNGEVIIAKQDTVASGIQYSNEHYLYKEHRGDISIYKDGVLVWDNIR